MATGHTRDQFPTVSVQPDAISHADVKLEVEVLNQFSKTEPAALSIQYTNAADTRQESRFGMSPPFSTYTSEQEGPGLLLIPDTDDHIFPAGAERIVPEEPSDGCWRVEGHGIGEWHPTTTVTLEPGQSVSERYRLLAKNDNDPCLPAGEYRFEESHFFGHEKPWGFQVLLQE